ncbi:rab GTPase-activating protein 22-like isoform X1 [Arachis stenosperma]|uniref:rab GTPase-activating protein 22-like isoform X1 n=1 Tax=Arachis stenosperma TaxID=217475 RepID=UPI0025ACD540|nr:rab GTPase-activating protein 22-like isoform X1 [Arachis stenosperma]
MISSSYLNSNNDSPFISGGSGGGGGSGRGRLSLIMAAVAAPSTPAVVFTALAGLALVAVIFYGASRGRLKSPWSRRRRKHALSPQQWKSLFTLDGKLRDGGIKFLKRVRSGGVDTSIRAEVWPFLLGVYDLDSTKEERDIIRTRNRKEYEKLRRRCRQLLKQCNESFKLNEIGEISYEGDGESLIQASGSPSSEDATSARQSLSSEERSPDVEYSDDPSSALLEGNDVNNVDAALDTDSTDSDSSDGPEVIQTSPSNEFQEDNTSKTASTEISSSQMNGPSRLPNNEDFATWQRIIRLDAVRANAEWIPFSPCQAVIPESRAIRSAEAVGLKEYGHLEPNRIFHAARLVAILEAYALYDPEIGYCQGMSDLLSPIVSVISEDHEAFWCFVGFMKKARQNFRLDEVGIRRQLDIVAKIIKFKDSHLFRHLEKLQADDCFFVYRMVVVLFRRELTFEQTLCLWEVMWADQAAIRAGIGKSAWSRIRQRAPPTDDLLLYAIAASVLQRRKLIIEKYSSMDEIIKECNGMAGHLDIWKLLDDAHNLVVTLHDKMKLETSFR